MNRRDLLLYIKQQSLAYKSYNAQYLHSDHIDLIE